MNLQRCRNFENKRTLTCTQYNSRHNPNYLYVLISDKQLFFYNTVNTTSFIFSYIQIIPFTAFADKTLQKLQ